MEWEPNYLRVKRSAKNAGISIKHTGIPASDRMGGRKIGLNRRRRFRKAAKAESNRYFDQASGGRLLSWQAAIAAMSIF